MWLIPMILRPRWTCARAGDAARAQVQRGFTIIGINHMSYTCPDYARARDWYASVLNMKSEATRDDGKRANLMFGPEPGKSGSFLVARNPGSVGRVMRQGRAAAHGVKLFARGCRGRFSPLPPAAN